MKNGLYYENDELVYYENDQPKAAGVIQVSGDIYYISSSGRAVKGDYAVHWEKANGILQSGQYTFGDDYKLIEDSFRPIGYEKRKRRNRLSIALVVVLLIAAAAFGIYRAAADKTEEQPITQDKPAQRKDIVLPTFDEEVLLCSPAAKKVYDHEMEIVDAIDGTNAYQPMVFTYQLAKDNGILEISQDPDFRTCRTFTLPKAEERIEIDNLLTGTDYYYRVLVGEDTYEGAFRTAESTRFVSIPGLGNTRDIGGYKTMDGRTVRQGLLIRGVEIDGLVESVHFMKKDRIEEVQETFGFVYDFDLRGADVFTGAPYQSRLGEEVGHRFYDSAMYGNIFQAAGAERVRYIFHDLAKPENYPMYFHCTYGTDRTGTMIFLLQSLLGMSEEDMIREYRLTAFWNTKMAESDYMDIIIDGMQSYPGDTLQEKVEYYMLNVVGITEDEIESIRSIFLEP